jgi:hypothetical protein
LSVSHLISQLPLRQRDGRQEKPKVEIFAKLNIGNDTEIETGLAIRVYTQNAIVLDKAPMWHNVIPKAIRTEAKANTEVVAALEVVIIESAFLGKSLRRESEDKN